MKTDLQIVVLNLKVFCDRFMYVFKVRRDRGYILSTGVTFYLKYEKLTWKTLCGSSVIFFTYFLQLNYYTYTCLVVKNTKGLLCPLCSDPRLWNLIFYFKYISTKVIRPHCVDGEKPTIKLEPLQVSASKTYVNIFCLINPTRRKQETGTQADFYIRDYFAKY